MGVILAVGRLGSVINDNISALLPIRDAYWVAAGMCALSTLSAWFAVWLDAAYTQQREHQRSKPASGSTDPHLKALAESHQRAPNTDSFWDSLSKRLVAVAAALYQFDVSGDTSRHVNGVHACTLQKRFWVLGMVCITGFTSVSSFNNVAGNLLIRRWTSQGKDASQHRVNFTFSLVYLVSAILASPAGFVVDYTQRRAIFTALSSAIVVSCHIALEHTTVSALAIMIVLGIGFSLYAASFWPSVAYIVPQKFYGIAYGVVGCMQNTGLATVPLIVGVLQPPRCDNKYVCVLHLFAGLAATALACSLFLAVCEERAAEHSPLRPCVGRASNVDMSGGTKPLLQGGGEHDPEELNLGLEGSRRRSGAFSEDDRTHLALAASSSVLREVGDLLHHSAAGSMALALACESREVASRRILSSSLTREDSLFGETMSGAMALSAPPSPLATMPATSRQDTMSIDELHGVGSTQLGKARVHDPRAISTASSTFSPFELTDRGDSSLN